MTDKRYGAHTGNTPAGDFEGWTLDDLASTSACHIHYVGDLARDLVAAQARIAELEADARAVDSMDECRAAIDRGTIERYHGQLAAAEATIAKGTYNEGYDDGYTAALDVDDLEAALAGHIGMSDAATAAVAELKRRLDAKDGE